MRWLGLLCFVFVWALSAGCQEVPATSTLYFDQLPPGDTPAVFAPGIISQEDRFEQFLLVAPNGRELTFGVTNSDWSAFTLYQMKMEGEGWTEPMVAPFLGSDPSALTACLSVEMDRAFFTAARPSYPPADIWMSERGDAGWSEPTRLEAPRTRTSTGSAPGSSSA